MIPTPEHLRACTVPEPAKAEQHQYAGHVKCLCRCDTFEMQHTGATHAWGDEIIPCVTEIDGNFFLRIVAKCVSCGAEHLLLDKDFHGWNGYVCREREHDYPRPPLVVWPCRTCGKVGHKADIVVCGEDKDEAIEASGGRLDESNWQEGFGWIEIDICCVKCGHRHESWVSYETM